ncbi:MAG: SAM-dependent chlorinase/fluorinase [Nitrospinae bacterium]|nr:SAM-dependent chlorinase/fluorinase [Nitrospinota bacterium]
MAIITLTTDFGITDPFVGVMKGVMLSINPSARFVDITHEIEPQNIKQAVYVISSSFEYFPAGSIHLCVVDPGVGSERKPLAFEAEGHFFVGPDNGIFTEVARKRKPAQIREITNPAYMLEKISATFHGRDIFAPSAAHLSMGAPLESFGPRLANLKSMDLPWEMRPSPNLLVGEIIYIDQFGNAITNLTRALIEKTARELNSSVIKVELEEASVDGILPHYSAAGDEDTLSATFGSWDTLELFVKNGDAALLYGLETETDVRIRFL